MLNLDDNLLSEILIGLFVAVFLAFLMGGEFYDWALYELISYSASVFFIMPIALGIIQRKFPKEYLVLTLIGGIVLIVYAFVLNLTATDIAINILKTVLIITIFSAFFSILKRTLEKSIPPPWRKK